MWNSYIKPVWDNIAKAITDSAIFKAATRLWNNLLDAIHKVFAQIAKWWNDFKKWLGLEGNASVTVKQKVSVETEKVETNNPTVESDDVDDGKKIKVTATTKAPPTKGSLNYTEAQINALSTKLRNTNTEDKDAIEALKTQIAELQKVADAQKIELGLSVPKETSVGSETKKQIKIDVKPEPSEGSLKHLQKQIAKQKAIIQISSTESQEYKQAVKTLQALTLEEQKVKVKIETDSKTPDIISKEQSEQMKKANKEMYDGIKSSWGAATGLADSISEISEGFEDMSALEIIESIGSTIFSVIDNVTTLISSINAFSSALSNASAVQTATSAASVASSQAETTASLANTAAKSGEAIAGATASGAKLPFPANLAAIAAGVAAVVGVLAMITGFANGGIVGGSTTVGDYNLIRANKGEMILNNK